MMKAPDGFMTVSEVVQELSNIWSPNTVRMYVSTKKIPSHKIKNHIFVEKMIVMDLLRDYRFNK